MAQRLLYRNAAGRGTSNQAVVSFDIVLCNVIECYTKYKYKYKYKYK